MKSRVFTSAAVIAVLLAIAIAALTGIYTVQSGEEAVVLRFGEYLTTVSSAGLNFRIPGIDQVYKVNVSEVRRIEFGFASDYNPQNGRIGNGFYEGNLVYEDKPSESLMLTGDENLANVETIVQYRVSDSFKYLFEVDNPTNALRVVCESSIRRGIANHTLDEALTDNKVGIQQEIKDDIQRVCDKYNIGVIVTAVQLQDVNPPAEVDEAFRDVAGAREDHNSYVNQANTYRNEILPKARGDAAQMLNEAEAYKSERISKAEGDVASFNAIYARYIEGKDVTRTRMYLEAMEEILPGIEKYIVSGNSSTYNLLPLGDLLSGAQAGARPEGEAGEGGNAR